MSSDLNACVRVPGLAPLLFAGLIHAAGEPTAVAVGPDDAVITLQGFCAEPARTAGACKTVITRAQFDKLIDALQPDMPPPLKLKVANAYARNLRMAAAAEQRGLDKRPEFQEEMRYARMQLLSQDLDRLLQMQSKQITDAELKDYYQRNQSSFEQASVARIFIPPAKSEAAMTQLAAALRARAVKGEDPDTLQLEAYAAAGMPKSSVNTRLVNVRRSTVPPRHESVLSLRAGDVSEVFADPGGAHYIYKMIDKQTLTLDQATAEMRIAIANRRYRDSIQEFQGGVVFSDDYFNPPAKPAK
jgi:parvulin-like peptidyl-prolyl isomerase